MTLSISDLWSVPASAPWLPVVDAVIKATVLLCLAAGLSFLLRRASAAARHFVWTLGLVSALVLPALSFALPRWELPLITLSSPAPLLTEPFEEPTATAPRPTRQRALEAAPAAASPNLGASPAPAAIAEEHAPRFSWPAILFAIWCAGALAVISRLIVGLAAVQWMSRRTERVAHAPWLPLARELAAHIGVRSDLTYLRSPRTTMPMAWGIVTPAVLMPAEADEWPLERLRIVLLHELAHVKRRDCLTHALAQVACAVYWFNPLAWIAARRLRSERERACDDLVLAAGTRGSDYANQLLEIARVMRSGRFPALLTGATLAMAHRSQLEGRLMAILDPRVPRSGVSRVRSASATVLVAGALLPLASLQPWAYAALPPIQQQVPVVAPAPGPVPPPSAPAPAPPVQAAPAPEPAPAPAPSGQARPIEAVAAGVAQAALDAIAHSGVEAVAGSIVTGAVEGAIEGAIHGAVGAAQAERQRKADPRMVAALSAALKDSDAEVRKAAMQALVQLRDPSIFEPLLQALRDASPDIREHAAMALGQLRDARAIDPLNAALKDVNADVREQVVFALGQLKALGSLAALSQALKDEDADVREQAAFALGQLRDPRAVDALIEAMKDSSPDVREHAAFALSQIRDRRALAALSAAVSDSSDSVREQAVFALGQLRDPAAIDSLMAALKDNKADIRQNAAFALGQIRDRRAAPALTAALKDADPEVRSSAAFSLGQLKDRAAVDALVVAIKDGNAEVRAQIAFALGQLGDPRAIDALTAALKDPNSEVRQQAAFALGHLAR